MPANIIARNADRVQSGLLIVLSVTIPFGIIPLTAIVTTILTLWIITTERDKFPKLLKTSAPLLIPFLIILVWLTFGRSATLDKLHYMEKYVLMFFVTLVAALPTVASMGLLKAQMAKAFVFGTCLLSLVTLVAAVVNYLVEGPGAANNSDWLFHMQLSKAFLDLHPTYLSLCTLTSILLLLYLAKPSPMMFALLGFLSIMTALLFVRTALALLAVILVVYLVLLIFRRGRTRDLVTMLALVAVTAIAVNSFSRVYNHDDRRVFVNLSDAWTDSNAPGVTYSDRGIAVRFAIWQASWNVFMQHAWFGLAPHRESAAISGELVNMGHPALVDEDLNAHNQLLSFLICYGFAGTALILMAAFLWIKTAVQNRNTLYLAMLAVMVVCSLTESILNRAYGVSVFAFLNALLFFNPLLSGNEKQ